MRAVIIAGGLSKRLRPRTENIPKTLLKLDEKIILEHILDSARAGGIKHFELLTGHGHDYVEGFMRLYKEHYPEITFDITYIDRYADTGNIIALEAGHHLFDDDIVIINSDTIFHSDIIKKLLSDTAENAMIVDDVKELGEEEMKVLVDDDHIIYKIHKSLDPQESHGEYVGVMKFGKNVQSAMKESVSTLMAEDDSLYYEDAIQKMIDDNGIIITSVSTEGLPVMEIDTEEDLDEAKGLIKKILE